jgi:hypothetical protein
MSMKVSSLIFVLAIFFLVLPAAQAADQNYTSLKNEYIQKHPGQAIIPFPWDPVTSTKVLPFNFEIPAAPGNTISMTACRNEFEPASFIINAQKYISGITLIVPNLYDAQGNSIPSSAVDVRLVKVWYQANNDTYYMNYETPAYYLTPELLLKDDSLVNVDYVTRTNYLKATINGVQQYIDISSPTASVPLTAQVRDAATLQPFSLKANENKQIWITVHVPDTTPAGNYSGNITITAPSEKPVSMNFTVTVLPFNLEPAPVDYGLYYTTNYDPDVIGFGSIASIARTPANMLAELQDMKDHGVLFPTFFTHGNTHIDEALALRDTVGFPKDKIYTISPYGAAADYGYIGNAADPAGLAVIANKVVQMRNKTEAHGYTDTYFYGIDEAYGDELLSQRPAWQTVHNNGGKIFASGWDYELIKMGDILDAEVVAYELNTTQAGLVHGYGHEILSYGNPQVGIENPEIYRNNYGFALWNAGYDGTMDFDYHFAFGDVWNDYDSPETHYRDHVFAYPTSNGVIDTIQWEGFREGVDDTRYVATLMKKEGSNTSAKTIVSAGLSNKENMTTIRKKVIAQILLHQVNQAPVLGFIENKTVYTGSSLTFIINATDPDGNNITYSASNLPINATFNPATRTFSWTPSPAQVGAYMVIFSADDGSLSDNESAWITVSSDNKAVVTPILKYPTLLLPIVLIIGLIGVGLLLKRTN